MPLQSCLEANGRAERHGLLEARSAVSWALKENIPWEMIRYLFYVFVVVRFAIEMAMQVRIATFYTDRGDNGEAKDLLQSR